MADTEWYRHTQWTPEIMEEFERRLSRSRGQRGEYLRIQALTLADSMRRENAPPAISLAQRYLKLKDEGFGVAQMHAAIARAFTTLCDTAAALDAYRCAVEAEHARPSVRGYHYMDFAWFAATHGLTTNYNEVLTAMERNKEERDLLFPFNQYRYFGALAMISADLGDIDNAKRMAKNALEAASKVRGPIPRHPELGLVRGGIDDHRARLERLAG